MRTRRKGAPVSPERTGRRLAPMIVVSALILFAWTHRHAPSLDGFADDLGLLAELPQLAATGQLWDDLWARVTGPLWSQSTMWRPWAYGSFGLDAVIWGAQAAGWHLTNLALHLAAAVAVGLLTSDAARLLTDSTLTGSLVPAQNDDHEHSGAIAFALFLLCPWAPEVTFWLVGRFDSWATLGSVLAVWAGVRFVVAASAPIRWAVASLAAAAVAYAAKESALLVVPWLLLLTIAGWRMGLSALWRRWTPLLAAHVALVSAYAWWRHDLFAGGSTQVYGGGPSASPLTWLSQLAAQLTFPTGLVPMAGLTAAAAGASALVVLIQDWRVPAVRRLRAVGLVFAASVLAAVALYLPGPPGAGEGYRLYYLAALGLAIALAAARPTAGWGRLVPIAVLMLACAHWQSRVAAEWTSVGRDVRSAAGALRQLGKELPASDYALVLMPDQHGHVPFARNAQGGLIALAERGDDQAPLLATGALLSRLIVFTPPQLSEWRRLASEQVVAKLTSRADAPANPTRYFCFDRRRGEARDLGYWSSTNEETWSRNWRERTARECPELLPNWQ